MNVVQKCVPLVRCMCAGLFVLGLTATPALAANVQVVLQDSGISPTEFRAAKGELVSFTIVNRGSSVHNFVIPDHYIFTSNLQPGESTTASFRPNKAGRFVYYSDKNGVPEPGIKGHMTVTE
jgi:uncharacterized cupredoxin-like copper-binding protein